MTQLYKILPLMVVLAFVLIAQQIDAKCDTCGSNGIACINETSFHMCYGSLPDTSSVLTCPEGRICVRNGLKCVVPGTGAEPDCIREKSCGECDGSKLFTCTSRRTYAMCNGTKIVENGGGVCPKNLICNSSGREMCVTECDLNGAIECDRDP
ncbi:uncharacterized protein LOC133331177 [Musca vetustissima]|uniref:uncharacterized protein LOC133331177 n=1 Tax=Musca vetustissima TaxID=27455 RepID=UPI002AB76939|nr:uncharacterized protein LOC133331177 [Musca vetustissima]